MTDPLKNIMIGIFVVTAMAVIVFALMFLHPSLGDEKRVLRVRFPNIDKISVGTRVSFAGKPVGEVAAIHEIKDAIESRQPYQGIIYVYELVLHVDSNVNVFSTDEISVRTSGLLGERSVVIIPLPSKAGEPLRLVNEEILYASEAGSVEDTLKEFKELAGKFDTSLNSISTVFNEISEEKIIEKLGIAIQNVNSITHALNQPLQLSQMVGNTHALTEKVLTSWERVESMLSNLSAASHNFRLLTDKGSNILSYVEKGQGTLGKLLMTDQLYLQVNSFLSKGETMMNDINHYGLLFNMDKGWQRLRARRLNLLYTLSTPQGFRNYFNQEIDQINTSLSRVYALAEQTHGSASECKLFEDQAFQKAYRELLRRVAETEEALKMYNQQLIDRNAKKPE
ncbi:MlaD family protein [Neochlamydia sp. AcF95]|uniref:MlaD family protein n=1 Tax=Neochlamydia sp. AcF95 TaxID=2795734 RepID=UPI001BCA2289|nr:MlaD family protein [Neochlamydia sp. AcF95]MBS4170851.1 Uncharacterized protein [Neochlamydia sp. AcF95]